MTIEYGVLETKRIKRKKALEKLEDELNELAELGWRVKCSVGTKIILMKKDG